MIRWHPDLGRVVIPKSVTPERTRPNLEVVDSTLTPEEMTALTGLDTGTRTGPGPDTFDLAWGSLPSAWPLGGPGTPGTAARVPERSGVVRQEADVAVCEVCGNDYRLSFEVRAAGAVHVFDSFECAIHAMAPVCEQCGVKVVGHGVEADGVFFCCASCARRSGPGSAAQLVDHAGTAPGE